MKFFHADGFNDKAGGVWVAFGSQMPACGVDDQLRADGLLSSSLSADTEVMVKWKDGEWFHAKVIRAVNSDWTFDVHSCYGEWYCRNYNIYYTFTLIKVSTYFISMKL